MTCDRETMLLISSYADGETAAEETTRAEAHIAQCTECSRLVEQWRGQREMFEWAYTSDIPEDARIEFPQELAGRTRMPITSRMRASLGRMRHPRPARAWAFAVAVGIVGFAIYHFASLPPLLKVGTRVAAFDSVRRARMDGGVQLQIGPGSRITRMGNNSIRLEKGWVSASVRHGRGLRVLTRRISVTDLGTRFRVGITGQMDYVTVDEGSVTVQQRKTRTELRAGEVLVARDRGKPSVVSLTDEKPEDSSPLVEQETAFYPMTDSSLDWSAGTKRLAKRYPHLRHMRRCLPMEIPGHGVEYRFQFGFLSGFRSGLRAHFGEIAQAMSGERVDPGNWEMPVAVMQLPGLDSEPRLPADFYYVRWVCRDGRIVWRFSGANGAEADYPLVTARRDANSVFVTISILASGGSLWLPPDSAHFDGASNGSVTIKLGGWPEGANPGLRLTLAGAPMAKSKVEHMLSAAAIPLDLWPTAKTDTSAPLVFCLDPQRKQRFLIAWNRKADSQLYHLHDLATRGRGGSVILGAIASDGPFSEPHIGAGAYLLRFTWPSRHIELLPMGRGNAAPLLLTRGVNEETYGESGWGGQPPEGSPNLDVVLTYALGAVRDGSIPFGFRVYSEPWDKPARAKRTKSMRDEAPENVLAEGWVRFPQSQ